MLPLFIKIIAYAFEESTAHNVLTLNRFQNFKRKIR